MLPTKPRRKPTPFVSNGTLLLLVLLLLLKGCATPSVPPEPVRLPALPTSAVQPTPPQVCVPSCLDSLTRWREKSADSLTTPTKPD